MCKKSCAGLIEVNIVTSGGISAGIDYDSAISEPFTTVKH